MVAFECEVPPIGIIAPSPGPNDVVNGIFATPVPNRVRVLVHEDPVQHGRVFLDRANETFEAFFAGVVEVVAAEFVAWDWVLW
jgi:hypothetical protein